MQHQAKIYLYEDGDLVVEGQNCEPLLFYFNAFGGDKHGSTYLQAFATYLREEYLQRPLDRIYLMVKQHMAKAQQVVAFFEIPSRLMPCVS